jgi:hypothetical protein
MPLAFSSDLKTDAKYFGRLWTITTMISALPNGVGNFSRLKMC